MAHKSALQLAYSVIEPGIVTRPTQNNPVFVLHGLFGSKRNWRTVSGILANKLQRKIINLDARNHGDSPHASEMGYHVMANDVQQMIMQVNNGSPTTLIGHSLGGRTAMTMALSSASNSIDKLVIADIAPTTSVTQLANWKTPSYIKILRSVNLDNYTSKREIEEYLVDKITDDTYRKFILMNLVYEKKKISWKINLDAINANIHNLVAIPDTKRQYDGKVLFIVGEKSTYINSDNLDDIKKFFPKYEMKVIAGAGHLLHVERPQEFTDIVMEFISQG
ncbi:Protein ABHD11 [Trichoplax sp. H2]|uniref:sn-1-specific diacylglycerol lipase ABHD11 n=1 Tax=Trichoplax adhaerens TaxID=10228 RepID=B3S521_TRIAD|nr:expressed hypothetical protein [Trichoplax adhaerens]EDV22190.1 expressed hypothetical protein [Trichoplax adhaerens]RDD46550.1 Protein ABHD11 [Trichoplax sp. H2]|eukprot:XP_002115345.1 expressed hypothetical protein [Trichoplax adhaerens]